MTRLLGAELWRACVDLHNLMQRTGFGHENIDGVLRHNRQPVAAVGEGCGLDAVGQGDVVGQGEGAIGLRRIGEAGDKGHDHDYKPANQHQGEHGDEAAEHIEPSHFRRARLTFMRACGCIGLGFGICHVGYTRLFCHRGEPA